jgi:small conductance mechanosensitive channel
LGSDPTDIVPILLPLAYAGLIVLVTWLVARLASSIVGRVMRQSMPLVAALVRRSVRLLIWLIGGILAIEELVVRSDILLLIVALFGIGVILTVRGALENAGAKYFADVYIPFKLGDSIRVRGHSGKVIEINSMSTILLGDDNSLISIPNSVFMKEEVINTSPQAWKEVIIPITIRSDIDLATFESAVLKSVNKLKPHLDNRFPPVMTMKSKGGQSTELSLSVMVRRPEQRDAIMAEVNKRIAELMETFSKTKKQGSPAG